jgi:hypothetical protein
MNRQTPKDGDRLFAEWASLFSEKLFVMLQVYADESMKAENVLGFCGYIESPEYWGGFRKKWKRILENYGPQYFHFKEFNSKDATNEAGSPYHNWSAKKRDKFLHELAFLASERATPVGGFMSKMRMRDQNLSGDVYEIAARKLFEDVQRVLDTFWPNYNGKVLFVFDEIPNKRQWNAVHEARNSFKTEPRFGGLTFEDDKDPLHTPLQVADLCAFVQRQYTEKIYGGEGILPPLRTLDFILLRNRNQRLRSFSLDKWSIAVNLIINHERATIAAWKKQGIKQKYYPEKHFPFEKYATKLKASRAV